MFLIGTPCHCLATYYQPLKLKFQNNQKFNFSTTRQANGPDSAGLKANQLHTYSDGRTCYGVIVGWDK